jgi:hypothetical protein
MGFGKVKCIFNNTYTMNATIMEENIMKCDSPPLPPREGFADSNGAPWFNISITLNGKEVQATKSNFTYYVDPIMKSITPNMGPMVGNTTSKIVGDGFA